MSESDERQKAFYLWIALINVRGINKTMQEIAISKVTGKKMIRDCDAEDIRNLLRYYDVDPDEKSASA